MLWKLIVWSFKVFTFVFWLSLATGIYVGVTNSDKLPAKPKVLYTIDVSHDPCDTFDRPSAAGAPVDFAASYERLYITKQGPRDWVQFRRDGRNEWVSRDCIAGRHR